MYWSFLGYFGFLLEGCGCDLDKYIKYIFEILEIILGDLFGGNNVWVDGVIVMNFWFMCRVVYCK